MKVRLNEIDCFMSKPSLIIKNGHVFFFVQKILHSTPLGCL